MTEPTPLCYNSERFKVRHRAGLSHLTATSVHSKSKPKSSRSKTLHTKRGEGVALPPQARQEQGIGLHRSTRMDHPTRKIRRTPPHHRRSLTRPRDGRNRRPRRQARPRHIQSRRSSPPLRERKRPPRRKSTDEPVRLRAPHEPRPPDRIPRRHSQPHSHTPQTPHPHRLHGQIKDAAHADRNQQLLPQSHPRQRGHLQASHPQRSRRRPQPSSPSSKPGPRTEAHSSPSPASSPRHHKGSPASAT